MSPHTVDEEHACARSLRLRQPPGIIAALGLFGWSLAGIVVAIKSREPVLSAGRQVPAERPSERRRLQMCGKHRSSADGAPCGAEGAALAPGVGGPRRSGGSRRPVI